MEINENISLDLTEERMVEKTLKFTLPEASKSINKGKLWKLSLYIILLPVHGDYEGQH